VTIRTIFRRCLQAVALSALCAAPLHAATISLSTASSTYSVGQSFSVDFRIGGLTGNSGDSLSGFDLDVLFDSGLLKLTGYGFTDPSSNRNELDLPEAGSFGFFGEASATGGVIDAFGVSGNSAAALDAGQAGEFRFLTLTFEALAASASTAIQVDLDDPALLFLDSGSGDLATSFGTARVGFGIVSGTTAVPEPGSLALLLVGAGGMMLAGRRRGAGSRRGRHRIRPAAATGQGACCDRCRAQVRERHDPCRQGQARAGQVRQRCRRMGIRAGRPLAGPGRQAHQRQGRHAWRRAGADRTRDRQLTRSPSCRS
jgi:hypothetical protein